MPKIVITQELLLSHNHEARLRAVGNVTKYSVAPATAEEYLERVTWADIILSEEVFMHENLYNLKNCFLTFPFSWFLQPVDTSILQQNNVVCAHAKWGNKYAVSERCIQALTMLTRYGRGVLDGSLSINTSDLASLQVTGVYGLHVLILGKGNIGAQTGKVCEALWAHVDYFTRWDKLEEKIIGKDVIINCLSNKDENIGLLSYELLSMNTRPFHYITIARTAIHDMAWITKLLHEWKIIWYADDCASIWSWDRTHEYFKNASALAGNTFITPHIARASQSAIAYSNDIIVANVEAYVAGKPVNVLC